MSEKYDLYLKEHMASVNAGLQWIVKNIKISDVLPDIKKGLIKFSQHDSSKYSEAEYKAYDRYFYGSDGVKSEAVEKAFDYAWLHHIHMNPHHWQHWILIEDDGVRFSEDDVKALEMPDEFVLEMICDWWSFSWRKGDLYEIFRWWAEHSERILLGEKTREKVEKLLELIREKLDSADAESVVMIVEK